MTTWRKASSFANAPASRSDSGHLVDTQWLAMMTREQHKLEQFDNTHVLTFNSDPDGGPLVGWMMRYGTAMTFAPTMNGQMGLWTKTFMPTNIKFTAKQVSRLKGFEFLDWALDQIDSTASGEKAHYIPKSMMLDGRARMWLRNRLMDVRFCDNSFSVSVVDNGRVITSDIVEGKPWEDAIGEVIAEWAKEELSWRDAPKQLTKEAIAEVAVQTEAMENSPAFALF